MVCFCHELRVVIRDCFVVPVPGGFGLSFIMDVILGISALDDAGGGVPLRN